MLNKLQRKLIASTTLLAVVSMTGLRAHAETKNEMMDSDLQALSDSNNHFAFEIYAQLSKSQSGNLFFSPTSIASALAMTYAGADGVTKREMAETLRFSLPSNRVHKAFASLMAKVHTSQPDSHELRLANRLWGQEGYGFLPEFLDVTKTYYGAEIAELDYVGNAEKARGEINGWVEEQTNGKIENLIPQGMLDSLTRLVLTNAIYFKGKWEHPFDKKFTKDLPFTVSVGKRVNVPMMSQKRHFKYGETDKLQILEMPYQGSELSMVVLLPKQVDGLEELERQLSADRLSTWLRELRSVEVETHFPRFRLEGQFQLNSILASLGMPTAFNPQEADFSGMNGKRDLHISAALHKSFVDVNEEGTEAAAATGIVMSRASMPLQAKVFQADHPFVFMIRDNRSSSLLFLGRLVDPQ
jgi:serpin B